VGHDQRLVREVDDDGARLIIELPAQREVDHACSTIVGRLEMAAVSTTPATTAHPGSASSTS
jgi:hypothetical protein